MGNRGDDICYNPDAAPPTEAPTPAVSVLNYYDVYGLGGDKYYGFPDQPDFKPSIAWTCPDSDHKAELERFGEFVATTDFFRNPGSDDTVPDLPCPDESFYEPEYPELEDPVGPSCDDVEDHVFCYQVSTYHHFLVARAASRCNSDECNILSFLLTFLFEDGGSYLLRKDHGRNL